MKRINIRYIVLLVSCFLSLIVIAQSSVEYIADFPGVIPQSPQVAAFARYGEYPVSKATGVPQIDIPLYEIKLQDIRIPISMSYHASGIKVEDVATPVGLGWALNSGGIITRSIYGSVDAQGYTNNHVRSSLHAVELMKNKNVDINQTWKKWGRAFAEDTQSDRYVYNFNGKSGVFRYNSSNNEITTIPYAPLIIEATPTGFKIKDTDGLIYHFEEREHRSLDLIAHSAAWHVTKIESQLTGAVINYKYKLGTGYIEYAPSQILKRGEKFYLGEPDMNNIRWVESRYVDEGEYPLSRIVYIPQLVDEITWGNSKIKFDYTTDRLDKYKDRLNSIKISSGNNVIKAIVFDNNSYWGNNAKNYRMKLNSVEIKGEDNSSSMGKFQFSYNAENLADYKRYEIVTDKISLYCNEDYWGYYNGKTTSRPLTFIPSEYGFLGDGTNRNPNAYFMQACILKEIKYPTGGTTTFEYESNCVSGAYDYNYEEAIVGGLRIKKIVSKTNGEEISKTYEYSGYPNQKITKDMFQYKQDRAYSFFGIGGPFRWEIHWSEWEIFTSIPLYSITGWSSSPVFYTTVTEYMGSKEKNIGKTVSQFQKNIRDEYAFPDYPNDIYNQNLNRFWSPYYNFDQGLMEPLLTSEEIYEFSNNSYTLKKEIINKYTPVDKGQITCGVRISFRDDWALHVGDTDASYLPYNTFDEFFSKNVRCFDLIAYRYFYLLDKIQTIEYNSNGNISTTVNYSYDPNYRLLSPVKTTVINSNNISVEESVTYPFNMSTAPYIEMTQNNIIAPVIKKTRLSNGSSLNIQNNYRKENSIFVVDNIQTGTNSMLENRLTHHNYDQYSNPLYISKDDATRIVYLWSYFGQYLVAEIRNSDYTTVNTALATVGLTSIAALSTNANPDKTLLDKLRTVSTLDGAHITTYKHKPLTGVLEITNPANITTYYDYDTFGQLKETYIIENNVKKLLQSYDYHYQNQ